MTKRNKKVLKKFAISLALLSFFTLCDYIIGFEQTVLIILVLIYLEL